MNSKTRAIEAAGANNGNHVHTSKQTLFVEASSGTRPVPLVTVDDFVAVRASQPSPSQYVSTHDLHATCSSSIRVSQFSILAER